MWSWLRIWWWRASHATATPAVPVPDGPFEPSSTAFSDTVPTWGDAPYGNQ